MCRVDRPRDQQSRGARRTGVLLLALLQFAAAGLMPVVDSAGRAVSLADTLRVEVADSEKSGSHHDHVTCQFCRVMSLAGEVASAGPWGQLPAASGAAGSVTPADGAPAGLRVSGGLGSRAPPLA